MLQVLDAIISDETDTTTGATNQAGSELGMVPQCSGHIICPTWKVIESMLEPPAVHIEPPPAPECHVVLLV